MKRLELDAIKIGRWNNVTELYVLSSWPWKVENINSSNAIDQPTLLHDCDSEVSIILLIQTFSMDHFKNLVTLRTPRLVRTAPTLM